jgi:hypothetical protein
MVTQVQNLGLANITAALVAYASVGKFLQWGTGSAVAVTGTVLGSTTGTTEARTSGTVSDETTTTTNDTFRVVGTIISLGTLAITEVGLFDAAGSGSPPTGGNMTFYGDFAAINLEVGDSITFTLDQKFDQA